MGSIIAFSIAISPYIFYSYRSFPQQKVWETFLFTYEANWYQEVYTSVWTFMGKFIPLYLLTIWFLTCKHWWYHVILIPIGMFLFQLISAINDDIKFSDEIEIWYLVPIMAVIVPLVYLIRAKIFASMHNPSLEEIEYELQNKKNIFSHFRDLFRN
ncbi:hypothetical protein GCM10008088_07340 [Mesonia mobilis]|uniref:Uncharacterized protein n=1 Tax=Mesonia mobilis TaxID=369791 RepID=A0ABQ3BJR4_9FLAO|nr:hypothetical protein [Mesonia mobilis]GGZ48613.1 hypothetical protein GCM10008088_07340 [Mesonia mobilis]